MQRCNGKIQRNNYHHGSCGPSLTGKTMSVFLIFTQGMHRNVKNRWVRSSLYRNDNGDLKQIEAATVIKQISIQKGLKAKWIYSAPDIDHSWIEIWIENRDLKRLLSAAASVCLSSLISPGQFRLNNSDNEEKCSFTIIRPWKFCKESAALWCMPAVSLDVNDLQVEVLRFCCRLCHCFAYFLKI